MLWKIRTELADRPGALAELAARCGADDINILSLEVFTAESGAVDELVVSASVGWTADDLTALVAEAGCARTTVRPCQADVLSDAPTRYLRAVLRLIDDPVSVDEELGNLQGFEEYTPAEWARADVLVEIAGRLAERYQGTVMEGPRPGSGVPELRTGDRRGRRGRRRHARAVLVREPHPPVPRADAEADHPDRAPPAAPAGGISIVAAVGDGVSSGWRPPRRGTSSAVRRWRSPYWSRTAGSARASGLQLLRRVIRRGAGAGRGSSRLHCAAGERRDASHASSGCGCGPGWSRTATT